MSHIVSSNLNHGQFKSPFADLNQVGLHGIDINDKRCRDSASITTTSPTNTSNADTNARSKITNANNMSGLRSGSSVGSGTASPNTITSDSDELPTPAHAQIFERSVQDCIKPLSRSLSVCKEDYIPSTLDATTSIFTNNTNLDEVEMVYSRRNSSVAGLQSALGRSRKNSVLSVSGLDLSNSTPYVSSNQKRCSQLKGSKSSLNFFSYVDLINNDEFAKKRPSFNSNYSAGVIPTKKLPLVKSNFMLSPETSGDENDAESDNQSLISSSMGDCLRDTKVEINY